MDSNDSVFVDSESFSADLKDTVPVIGNKKESLSWNDFDDYAECLNAIHKIYMQDGHFCEIVHIF